VSSRRGVDVVPNGRAAVDAALSGACSYDLVLMDIQMPELDGVSAARILKEAGLEAPIVALTAQVVVAGRAQEGTPDVFDAHLAKPIDVTALDGTLANVLRNRKVPPLAS
jgi:CheY-like chemotaxis protein